MLYMTPRFLSTQCKDTGSHDSALYMTWEIFYSLQGKYKLFVTLYSMIQHKTMQEVSKNHEYLCEMENKSLQKPGSKSDPFEELV
jgi:hypothetical protein